MHRRTIAQSSGHPVIATWLLGILATIASGCSTTQATFDSPDAASEALVAALSPRDGGRLKTVLGPEADELVSSGDEVADQNDIDRFIEMFREEHDFAADANGTVTLIVGDDDWPFSIPLVETSDGWRFDTEAGREELLNRRIGGNELSTIEACLATVDAQSEYAMLDPDGDGIREYARQFISDPGMRNGLYWPVEEGERLSPLGSLAAEAADENYTASRTSGEGRPYHGYRYRLLLGQGPAAMDGARDYVIGGRMIGGFALIARPATYGNSGIKTFIVNQDGIVYERHFGDDTEAMAAAITLFDPDSGWTAVNQQPFVSGVSTSSPD